MISRFFILISFLEELKTNKILLRFPDIFIKFLVLGQAESIITVVWPFAAEHFLNFSLEVSNIFCSRPFWIKIVVILWIFTVFEKCYRTVIISSAWLRTHNLSQVSQSNFIEKSDFSLHCLCFYPEGHYHNIMVQLPNSSTSHECHSGIFGFFF